MADEDTGTAPELGSETTTQTETVDDLDAEQAQADTNDEDEGEEPDFFEVEDDDGNKYQFPKATKPFVDKGVLRQKDYTRKTMDLAEQKRAFETESAAAREAIAAQTKGSKELLMIRGRLADVEDKLTRFAPGPNGQYLSADQINWAAWHQQNPKAAEQAERQLHALERQKGSLEKALKEGEQKYESEAQQATAKRIADTRAYAEANIPNWTPELDKAITGHVVKTYGFTLDELVQGMTPKLYRMAADAYEGHSKRETAAKRNAPAGSEVVPLRTVTGRSAGGQQSRTPPSDPTAYRQWRSKQAG